MAVFVVTRYRTFAHIQDPYIPAWVEALKLNVPSYARTWGKASRTWSVMEPFVGDALTVCRMSGRVQLNDYLPKPQCAKCDAWMVPPL
jgi:hypothetical protein